jgi:hypothetical protein
MNHGLRLTLRKGDLLAAAVVAAMAFAVLFEYIPRDEAGLRAVQVWQDGQLVRECALDADAVFAVSGEYENTVTIENGRVSITDSDCPGRDCVHSGWIDSAGRSVVCLPNRVEIRVTGRSEVDFTVR